VSAYHKVTYRVEQGIARIALNRPERRNALDQELLTELRDTLRVSAADESVRVVLLTGLGKDFCSGMDLRTFADDASGDLAKFQAEARNMARLLLDMRRHSKPILAAVHGRALGGGCGIATAADIVLAADSAQFGYPEINIGFVPAIVMAILRRSVSEKRAFELITSGEVISAQTAMDYGMINRVFTVDTFERERNRSVRGERGFQARIRDDACKGIVLSHGRDAVRSRA
jgi:methylglutaconyl-CoA hydratase